MFNKQQLCDIEARIDKLELAPTKIQMDYLDDEISSLRAAHELIRADLKRLTIATAEGIELIERKEKRIDATVGRARAQLKKEGFESPGLEAEAGQLRKLNGPGSEELGVPPVREEVAEAPRLAPKEFAVRAKFFGT